MKVGILTFHRALNYGAVLQCYSLKAVLENLGHLVEIIDYRPHYVEKYRKLFYWNDFKKKSLVEKILYIIRLPFIYHNKRRASLAFDTFLNSSFRFSGIVTGINDIPSNYDIIIFGSDQIWSPKICKGFDPVFFGQFEKKNCRFISYAASLEEFPSFTMSQWKEITELLSHFDAVSVREKEFKKELSIRTQQNIEWVVDPTLLISSNILEKVAIKPHFDKYVLLFTVQEGNLPYKLATQIAKDRGCQIVRVRAIPLMNIKTKEKGVINVGACSPAEFVGYIKYANCIVTNSFHATAISLQMQKDFYCAKCRKSGRLEDILSSLNISERLLSNVESLSQIKDIDFNDINKKIKDLSISSLSYLQSELNMDKKMIRLHYVKENN